MSTTARHCLSLILLSSLVYFPNLGVPALWDEDEPKNAACAREMLERNDWVVPRFNYELRTAKPVLLYWFMMSAYQVFGPTELGARFWSAVFGVVTVLLTYGIGRKLYSAETGWWAGVLLAAALMFGVSSRAATPDNTLIVWMTLGIALFVWRLPSTETVAADTRTTNPRRWIPTGWFVPYVVMYASLAMAVLAKGPVGIGLPVIVMMLYVLCERWRACRVAGQSGWAAFSPVSIWQIGWSLRPLTAIAMVCLIAIPWYVWVGQRTDGEWIAGFFGQHNLNRITQPLEGHSGPIYYYLVAALLGFFPGSVFLPWSIAELVQRLRKAETWQRGDVFCACWATVIIGLFSLASTKLPSYILPAYPALALITARLVEGWLTAPATASRRVLRLAFPVFILVGIVVSAAVPLATSRYLTGTWQYGWPGAILILGGCWGWHWFERGFDRRAAQAAIGSGLAFTAALFGFVSVQINPHQTSPDLLAEIRGYHETPEIATFDYFEPSVAYYAKQPVSRLKTADDALEFLREHPNGYLLMRDRGWEAVAEKLPVDVRLLSERQRFLKQDRILLLGRPAPEQLAGASNNLARR